MLIYGLFYLRGANLFDKGRIYFAEYEATNGLTASSDVTINGFKIGMVEDLYLNPNNSMKVIARFRIDEENFDIPHGSRAKIVSSDILGTKTIAIIPYDRDTTVAISGDTLIADKQLEITEQVNQEILPLKRKAEELISQLDTAIQFVQFILNEDTRDDLKNSFASINKAMANLERTSLRLDTLVASEKSKISSIFSKVDQITGTLAQNSGQIDNIIANFSTVSDSLAHADIVATIDQTKQTMQDVSEIMDKINNGEGTMGLLVNDTVLYRNLSQSASALDRLITDVKNNPYRYVHVSVFGTKVKNNAPFNKKEVDMIRKKLKE